jgi:ribose/xylose/arabinose/galactoside ABC-type transport system permease subunit
MDIRCTSIDQPVADLSGGNQQKVVLGKWSGGEIPLLLLDEPTRGVDVGAKAEVHRLIRELANRGVAILMVSSDMPEVLSTADRIVVMREGRVSGELSRTEATQEKVLALALPASTEAGAREGERTREPDRLPYSTGPFGAGSRGAASGGRTDQGSRAASGSFMETAGALLRRREFDLFLLILATVTVVSIVNPSFLSVSNVTGALLQVAPAVIVACAMTLVIVTREIDISVGSLSGLAAVAMGLAASADHFNRPVWQAVAFTLAVGTGVGLLNGVLVAFGRVPSMIVTLGMLTVLRGITQVITGGNYIQHLPDGLRQIGVGSWVGVPIGIWVAAAAVAFTTLLATQTPLGRRIYAVGNSPNAAALAGISPAAIRLFVFAFSGLLTGLSVLVSATQLSAIQSDTGTGFELMVVTCVVVGGTSIRGGRGTVLGSLLGVLLLGSVGTMLIFMKLSVKATYWEPAIQGLFILAAVVVDHLSTRRRVAA